MARVERRRRVRPHFRVRPLLLRFVVCAVSLALTAIIVPHVYFSGDYRILSWLVISVVFGLLVAFVKPLIQLLLLPLIFVSYGLVVVLINTAILWILALIFPDRFQVDTILWALLGGLVSGVLVVLLENLFGLAPPIVQTESPELKETIAKQKPGLLEAELLAVTSRDAAAPVDTDMTPDRDQTEGLGP